MHGIQNKKLLMLKPAEINLSLWRVRKNFNLLKLQRLAESIKENGVIQPLAVRLDENGRYELMAGERRLKAAIMAGQRRVPCVLHSVDSATAVLFSIEENLQRSDITFFERAEGIYHLIYECKLSQSEVSVRLGIPQTVIVNSLRLLRLEPNIRTKITENNLSEDYALALLYLPEYSRAEMLDHIIANNLSIDETEEQIFKKLNPVVCEEVEPKPQREEKPNRKSAIGDIRLFSNSLEKLTETLKNGGIAAQIRRHETDKYIEYKVRIKKEEPLQSGAATQLKIC